MRCVRELRALGKFLWRIYLKDQLAMDTARVTARHESGESRDHLDVFREFLMHLERAAGAAATAAQDRRRRANAR
jgi:hypothetical protein